MFGANEIVGKKYFNSNENIAPDKLFVTSMFFTLQGEGPYRGHSAFFVRLAKCNLNCSFCDTFFDDGDWLTFAEINDRIESTIQNFYDTRDIKRPEWTHDKIWVGDNDHEPEKSGWVYQKRRMVLVITGGEPMLQENLNAFLMIQNTKFQNTQIESNGTLVTEIPNKTTLVISPKCAEKKGIAIKYLTPRLEVLARADCLKFVMEAESESPYCTIPDWAHEWARSTGKQVFISPMNIYNDIPQKSKQKRAESNQITLAERSFVDEVISFWEPGLLDMNANQINHEYVAQYCVTYGYIMNLQIHLYASLA